MPSCRRGRGRARRGGTDPHLATAGVVFPVSAGMARSQSFDPDENLKLEELQLRRSARDRGTTTSSGRGGGTTKGGGREEGRAGGERAAKRAKR